MAPASWPACATSPSPSSPNRAALRRAPHPNRNPERGKIGDSFQYSSTAGRRPALGKSIQARLFGYMAGIVRQRGGVAHIVGGAENHVHLLLTVPASSSVADMLRFVKGNSSRWLNQEFPRSGKFVWQRGYAAFSVSRSRYRDVYRYIAGQEMHHRRISFQQKLVAILKKYQIEYDERYMWS